MSNKEHTWQDTIDEMKAWSETVYRLAYTQSGIQVIDFSWSTEYKYSGHIWVDHTYYKTEDDANKARLAYMLENERPLSWDDRMLLVRLLRGENEYGL